MEVALLGAMYGGMAGFMGGGLISGIVTMKESTKLKLDEEMVQSYMQGKGSWGHGYREEVAERGYSMAGPVPGQFAGRENERSANKTGRSV